MSEYYELYQQCRLERDLLREEIQKRDEILDSAKVVMDRCEFGLQPEFYGGKGNGSLKDVRQWLKQYEEMKR